MAKSVGGISALLLGVAAIVVLVWLYNGNGMQMNKKKPLSVGAASNNGYTNASNNGYNNASDNGYNNASDNGNGNGYGGEPGVDPAPLGYASYAYTDDNAYFGAYPQSEDSAALTSNGKPGDYQLQLNSLMPAGWGSAQGCPGNAEEGQWGKFAPTKQQFEQYITASGTARYGMNTRTQNPTGGIQGLTNIIWPVATPVDGAEIPFNDSSFRQDLVYDSMNFYPAQAQC